jgi:hypothetical protein
MKLKKSKFKVRAEFRLEKLCLMNGKDEMVLEFAERERQIISSDGRENLLRTDEKA